MIRRVFRPMVEIAETTAALSVVVGVVVLMFLRNHIPRR